MYSFKYDPITGKATVELDKEIYERIVNGRSLADTLRDLFGKRK